MRWSMWIWWFPLLGSQHMDDSNSGNMLCCSFTNSPRLTDGEKHGLNIFSTFFNHNQMFSECWSQMFVLPDDSDFLGCWSHFRVCVWIPSPSVLPCPPVNVATSGPWLSGHWGAAKHREAGHLQRLRADSVVNGLGPYGWANNQAGGSWIFRLEDVPSTGLGSRPYWNRCFQCPSCSSPHVLHFFGWIHMFLKTSYLHKSDLFGAGYIINRFTTFCGQIPFEIPFGGQIPRRLWQSRPPQAPRSSALPPHWQPARRRADGAWLWSLGDGWWMEGSKWIIWPWMAALISFKTMGVSGKCVFVILLTAL